MTKVFFSGILLWVFFCPSSYGSYLDIALKELSFVKSASLFSEPVEESPWPVSIITAEHLRRFGWLSIFDVLEYLPGFYITQDINERTVSHRGIYRTSTQYLLFLEDDFRLNLPLFAGFCDDWAYPLVGISKIEVIRGPGASLYGDSAFTGVVSIERDSPEESLSLGLGEYETLLSEASFHYKGLTLYGRYFNRQGEIFYFNPGEQRIHPTPNNYTFGFRWEKKDLRIYFSYARILYETPRGQKGQILFDIDKGPYGSYQETKRTILGLDFQKEIDGFEVELLPEISLSSIDTPQIKSTWEEEGTLENLDIDVSSNRYTLDLRLRKIFSQTQILLGAKGELEDYRKIENKLWNAGQVSYYDLPPDKEFNWAIYGEIKQKPSTKLTINLGARLDYYEAFGSKFSPRVALNYNLGKGLFFSTAYGEAFQAPPYFYREANPLLGYGSVENLNPEINKVLDFGIGFRSRSNCHLRADLFYQKTEDLWVFDQNERIFRNLGRYDLYGLEIDGGYIGERLFAFLNYSIEEVVDEEMPKTYVQGERISGIPKWALKGGISIKFSQFYLSPAFRWYGHTFYFDSQNAVLPAYIIWDLNFIWDINSKIGLSLKIDNLFDHHYYRAGSVPPYPQPGRLGLVKIEGRF